MDNPKYIWPILISILVAAYFLPGFMVSFYEHRANSPCNCKKMIEWNKYDFRYLSPSAKEIENRAEECIFKHILNSGKVKECAYFGEECAGYLEKNGVDCSEEKCGVWLLSDRVKEIGDLARSIQKTNKTLQERIEYYENAAEWSRKQMEQFNNTDKLLGGLNQYFEDIQCN